ncbi:MAG TPA: hypothetical protein DEQ02_03500, partial [Ruminococcaceae bacterium]|nr:hypothetical protein [Oscillospiraceae bacterium]
MNPDISIIVPVYNAARCLDRCVKSLAGQSLKSVEIILVNDGSSDGSGDLCDRFAAEDIRITAVHQTNAGPSSARNTGLTKAKGEYILFVDADDWMEPDAAEIMLRKARQCAADVTLGSYSIDYANNSYQIVKDMPELPDGTQDISGVIFALD